ncbi:MAG: vWA domain-containing protein, partial [Pirellulales bacterium]
MPRELWWALGATAIVSVVLCIAWLLAAIGNTRVSAGQALWALAGAVIPSLPIVALIALVIQQRDVFEEMPTSAAADTRLSAPTESGPESWRARVRENLVAKGTETRLGQALEQSIAEEQVSPTAAVIVFTDGGQNAGADPAAAIKEAKRAKIPIFPIGVGSNQRHANVRVAELAAPARVFPDDSFDVTAFIQASGLAGRMATVELFSLPADAQAAKTSPQGADAKSARALEKREATERVKLAGDGEAMPVKFVLPPGKPGRRTYVVRVESLPEDHEPKDNDAQASVDVVERKLRVLLLAGGPSREYQYLRNMLHRDRNVAVDVLLQIAKPGPGISQDADQILGDLPATKADWAAYDALVALDPDWRAFPAEAIESLEEWVGNQSGGLIVAAGPVYTGVWTGDPKAGSHLAKMRALYPVTFPRHGLVLATDSEKFRSTSPWPVELSRAGAEAPFLRLDDSPAASGRAWNLFPGVFGYYPVTGVKPGATVYARYGTPDVIGEKPVYLAGHFYGSGRVFYLGGGEMWRLRGVEEAYFEMFYTRLLRYVSEGRLLRGNKRGSLLVDRRRYVVGDAIEVQAILADARREPLVLPRVKLEVITPAGHTKTIELAPYASRKGLYHGDFLPTEQGTHRLELETSGTPYELLWESVRVLEPDLEQEHSQRNDVLLGSIAEETGGKYYHDLASIHGGSGRAALADEIGDATRIVRVRGIPSPGWDERWARVLVA